MIIKESKQRKDKVRTQTEDCQLSHNRRSPKAQMPYTENDKLRSVYAAYLNMARMNLYNTLRFIGHLYGMDDNIQEGEMDKMKVANFANHPHLEKRLSVRKALLKHLPFLHCMAQAYVNTEHKYTDDNDLQKVLLNIINVVSNQRDHLTHANPYNNDADWAKQKEIEKQLLEPLEKAFMFSKRKVETIFDYSKSDMSFIDRLERMMDTGDTVIVKENNKERELRDNQDHSDYYFRLRTPEGDALSTVGLTFLICKLLHKKHATIFAQRTGLFLEQSHLDGYSPFSKRENEIMFNIFCHERIRLPKGRLESTTDPMALGLDMLAELQKCPAELFNTFGPSDRKLFEVRNEDFSTDSSTEDIILMRRYGDRFARLAMQYIDSFNADPNHRNKRDSAPLPGMAFQVSVGKFRHTFYERAPFHEGVKDRVRVLQKEINGFGPLTKIEDLRQTDYALLIRQVNDDSSDRLYDPDTAQTRPYITDHHASYAITGDRIGLMWNDENVQVLNNDTLCYLPELLIPTATDDSKKPWNVDLIVFNRSNGGHPKGNIAPRAWLSIYDLPALIFLHFLGGKPASVIKDTYNSLMKLFDDIAEGRRDPYFKGQIPQDPNSRKKVILSLREQLTPHLMTDYGLHTRDIPDKVVEYLIGEGLAANEQTAILHAEERFRKWCDIKVKAMKKDLDLRIEHFNKDKEQIGNSSNRIGSKRYVDLRPGSLARYLAKDMIAMVDPKDGAKPSGLDFTLLQAAIATYQGNGCPLEKTELGATIKKAFAWQAHPFLPKIMNLTVSDTIDLYSRYQNEKTKYLDRLLQSHKYSDTYFLRNAHRNMMAKTRSYMRDQMGQDGTLIEGLAHRYRKTLQLPDGLFTNAIREQLAKINNSDIQDALNNPQFGHSAAYLLNLWFTKIIGDQSQPFYRSDTHGHYKRHYKLLETLYPKKTPLDDATLAAKLKGGKNSVIKQEIDKQAPVATKEAEHQKLMHLLRDLQRNERTIRRYRNQDMVLFLMAKKLLLSGGAPFMNRAESDGSRQFLLQNIVPIGVNHGEGNNLLNQKVSLSTRITLLDDKNKPIKDSEKHPMKRTIHQKEIKMKNYGDFFRFLYDSRIGILLSQLPDDEAGIAREKLEKELDTYDNSRTDIFKVIHKIERQIIEEHPELKNPNSNHFTNDKGTPYRNNFTLLLTLSALFSEADHNLNQKGKLLKDIRDAFCHNKYIENIERAIKEKEERELPKIAENLTKWMKEFGEQS